MRWATLILLIVFSHAAAAPDVWRDTGILLDAPDTAPRHAVLSYREAIHFGMRFLHGIDVWPLDPDDRRVGSRLRALPKMMAPIARLRPPGAPENLLK